MLLLGCESKRVLVQPKFLPGHVEKFHWSTDLQSGLSAQTPKPWARQQAILVLTVDSLGDSGMAYMHASLDSLSWQAEDRDSLEIFYMVSRLKQYRLHFRLSPNGSLSHGIEEPTLPSLSPSWLSPAQLLAWALPFWAPTDLPSDRHWTTEISWPASPCGWQRRNEFLPSAHDTLSWGIHFTLAPLFDSTSTAPCPEPAWSGEGEILGNGGGLGLKEFKLQMQADFPLPLADADSASDSTGPGTESASITLIRRISFQRL